MSRGVLATIRAGGVHVRSGCFADGRYAHGKDMSASYVVRGQAPVLDLGRLRQLDHPRHGERPGRAGDERAPATARFGRAFSLLTARDDGVFGRDCVPSGGD